MTWETAADGHRLGRSQLRLAGLSCAGCAAAVERALRAEPGVVEASASYGTQRASVLWDPGRTRAVGPSRRGSARRLRRGTRRRSACARDAPGRGAQGALAALRRRLLHDAGDDVPGAALSGGARRDERRPAQRCCCGRPGCSAFRSSCSRRRRCSAKRGRACASAASAWTCRSRSASPLTFIVSTGATFAPGPLFGSEPLFDSLTMFVSFLLAGRWLALKMRNRVAASLEGALSRLPAAVRIVGDDGTTTLVPLHRLQRGDRVRVLAGEAFPPTAACSKATPRSTRRSHRRVPAGRRAAAATKRSPAASTCAPRSCSAPSASAPTRATKESSA